jgi:hypothetical protein
MQWKCLPVPRTADGKAEIHYTTIYRVFARWSDDGSLDQAFIASVRHLAAHGHLDLNVLHGDGIGYSDHKHQKGEKILAIIDNKGFVLAPLAVAPAIEADTVLLPEGLNALKRMARLADLKIGGSYLNLDGGFDFRYSRRAIFNAGLIPTIKENPRNREIPKRGRKRLFNAAVHLLRLRVERTFAWEDKIKNPRSKLRGIGGRKEADQKNAASCGEYVPKEIQTTAAAVRVHSATALRHEVDGVHANQPEAFLRCLKLATDYLAALGGASSVLGQRRDDDIARLQQDGFLFVRRALDEAKSSEQEDSFNSQQCVTDFMHIATFRSKRIEQ